MISRNIFPFLSRRWSSPHLITLFSLFCHFAFFFSPEMFVGRRSSEFKQTNAGEREHKIVTAAIIHRANNVMGIHEWKCVGQIYAVFCALFSFWLLFSVPFSVCAKTGAIFVFLSFLCASTFCFALLRRTDNFAFFRLRPLLPVARRHYMT